MNPYTLPPSPESLRLEAVTVCVGFDDVLDVTLALNHPHVDTMIVVTSHDDRRTHRVARKHGAICVQTDIERHSRDRTARALSNSCLFTFANVTPEMRLAAVPPVHPATYGEDARWLDARRNLQAIAARLREGPWLGLPEAAAAG